jgi:LuxR family maltose regulon positive regulatory protein
LNVLVVEAVVDGASPRPGAAAAGARAGLVRRDRLLDGLRGATDARLVLVVAGGGYGKTTLVSQWLADDERPVVWLTATRQHDDPAVLLGELVPRLEDLEPFGPIGAELTTVSPDFSSVVLPRLERAVAARTAPFVLVVDDAHRLRRASAWSVVQAVAANMPPGSQLVVVSRSEPELALGRLRADGRVHTITTRALAMDRDETDVLLAQAGFALPVGVVDGLWARTEGWPVGLYLSTLALAEEADAARAAAAFAGDDRLVTDYVREELLATLSPRLRSFLLEAAVLDEIDTEVCDHVLARDDSATVLAEAARSTQLVLPLDRRDGSFRIHQLLRDTLRAELVRGDPTRARRLHERAADWYEAHGQLDRGIVHRQAVGDRRALEGAIFRAAPYYGGIGRTATVEAAIEGFRRDEVQASPGLTVTSAWLGFVNGDMPSMRYWTGVASAGDDDVELPDGNRVGAHAALLRALVGADGIEAMRVDAVTARDLDRARSPYRAISRYLEGLALRTQGRSLEARSRLEEGEAIGAHELPSVQAHCLAQLASFAIEEGDWDLASRQVDQLNAILDRFALRGRPAQGSSEAVAALVHAHVGDSDTARREAKRSLFLISMLATVAPLVSIDARIHLARALLLLGDVALARTLTREAVELLALVPDGEVLRPRLDALQQAVTADAVPVGVLAAPMTPAELRVLRYLPTHLTFAGIADELFVSRNTVKTQAISIYRKLDVSSRGNAVEAARGLGLLDDVV